MSCSFCSRERESRPLSGRSDSSRPNSARNAVVTHTSITPVKISRNNLRLMSEKEVSVRRSNLSTSQQSVGSPPPPHGMSTRSFYEGQGYKIRYNGYPVFCAITFD